MSPSKAHQRLAGKTAVVTGAASGIGRETALLFAREGARVVVVDRNIEGARKTCAEIENGGGQALAFELDVTSEPGWSALMAEVESAFKQVDVLTNSAGITDNANLTELDLDRWRRIMAVNLDGTFLGTAAAIRSMTKSGKGSIINVASASGIKAVPGSAAYCSSKAAVLHLTRCAALECSQLDGNIRVNCVVPGGVRTPMWETTAMWPDIANSKAWTAPTGSKPFDRFADPLEIAQPILFLASDESSFVTGASLVVDGGYTAG